MIEYVQVSPFMGEWIEISALTAAAPFLASHPSWVSGLKLSKGTKVSHTSASHPSWVSGLKYRVDKALSNITIVSPFMGEWIEISYHYGDILIEVGLTLHG